MIPVVGGSNPLSHPTDSTASAQPKRYCKKQKARYNVRLSFTGR
ncbi:conserved protein of unknown function [Stenotrophomonas maltophilia]|nr:conserved protein of unknown function [Stenotrophomonas maltophilia]